MAKKAHLFKKINGSGYIVVCTDIIAGYKATKFKADGIELIYSNGTVSEALQRTEEVMNLLQHLFITPEGE